MKKSSTSERLKEILRSKNLKQVDILNMAAPICDKYHVKLNKSDLSQYISGKVEPGQDKLSILGMALNVNEAWLMGYDVPIARTPVSDNSSPIPSGFEPLPQTVRLPRVGQIACGTPILAETNIDSYDNVPQNWHADFTLLCKGDSMEPKIKDGDIVAIRKQESVENGEIAAVRVDCEATLKRVFLFPDHLELRAENPAFASILLIGDQMNDAHIEGKAVGLCRGL